MKFAQGKFDIWNVLVTSMHVYILRSGWVFMHPRRAIGARRRGSPDALANRVQHARITG